MLKIKTRITMNDPRITINILYEQLHGNYMFIEVSDVLTEHKDTKAQRQ